MTRPVTAQCPRCGSPEQPVFAFDGSRGVKCDACKTWTVIARGWN